MRRVIVWILATMFLAGLPAVAFAEDVGQDTMTEALVVATPLADVGSAHAVDGSTYKVTSNSPMTVTFTKSKNAKSITVPDTVKISGKAYKVTKIAPNAFASAKKTLTTVKIGKNVTIIGASAFAGCAKLKTVTGGAAVKTIKTKVFKSCKVMTKCSPLASKKLKTIGASALSGAKKLKTVTVKSKKLTKKKVKGALKGSSVKTVKVSVGKAKVNKTYVKKYKKLFTKANCGKKVKVK